MMVYHCYHYNSNQTTWSFSYLFIWPHFDFATQVDDLLKQRDNIHCSFTVTKVVNCSGSSSGLSNGTSSSKIAGEDSKAESPVEDGNGSSDGKDKSGKKKWFNLNLKGSDKKLGWKGVWNIFWYYLCLKIHRCIQMFGPPGCGIGRLSLYVMLNFSLI